MWHASVAPFDRLQHGHTWARTQAHVAIENVGSANLGQWEEWTGCAFHLRRRLSDAEVLLVGPVVDVRGTAEGRRRLKAIRDVNPYLPDIVQ